LDAICAGARGYLLKTTTFSLRDTFQFLDATGHNISDMQILFNKTIEECRQLGARGGRACGRNERLRKAQAPPPAPSLPPPAETARQPSWLLDAQFPWLTGRFTRPRRAPRRLPRLTWLPVHP
jgi:hypothetical protein